MKKTFISALILTALFTVAGCEDKEAKATIAQQTQTIAQLTAENTQLKAEKEKAEKVIPAIFAEKDVIFEKVEKIVDHKKYYPGWHMNKKYWYTIILDGSISLKDIYKCIDESYQMTK